MFIWWLLGEMPPGELYLLIYSELRIMLILSPLSSYNEKGDDLLVIPSCNW